MIFVVAAVRASYAKPLRSKKHLENEKQFKRSIPQCLIQDLIENKPEQLYNPKSLKQIARKDIEKNEKESAKKLMKPYYFTDRALQVGFVINLDSHNTNHAISELTIKPNFQEKWDSTSIQ